MGQNQYKKTKPDPENTIVGARFRKNIHPGQSQDNRRTIVFLQQELYCARRLLTAGNQEHLPETKNICRESIMNTFGQYVYVVRIRRKPIFKVSSRKPRIFTLRVKTNTITGKVIYIIHAHHLGKL